MTPMIEIDEGIWIQPHKIACVRESTVDKKKTVIQWAGQSSQYDGLLVDRPVDSVAEHINDALSKEAEHG